MKRLLLPAIALALSGLAAPNRNTLPDGFVYLSLIDPSIVQDIRYSGYHNFVGRPVRGYDARECILTRQAAVALQAVEHELNDAGLALRVYDCYRPVRAQADLLAWTKDPRDQRMKPEYYPRVDKSRFLALGYLAAKSSHSSGSTVDVTIVRLPSLPVRDYGPNETLHSCIGSFAQRYHDGSIDMGTTFDCMDALSNVDAEVGPIARSHRTMLREVMKRHGFQGVKEEWWHFSLRWQPYPNRYFDFPIVSP